VRGAAEDRLVAVDVGEITVGDGDHVVQFYERDAELLAAVTPYLAEAVRAGEVAIVIATEAHHREFEGALEADGVDLVRARAEGTFVALDAAATMALFIRDGRIDRDSFHDVIGGIVRPAAASGRRVRAYGEMVALLWDAGDVLGAIELETLWHELGREVSFSLFCSYPAASVSAPHHADALHRVCHLHSAVLEPPAGSLRLKDGSLPKVDMAAEFAAEHDMPGRARRLVVAALQQCGYDERLVADAALVLSELASNAVVHAGSSFSVAVASRDSTLRIAVSDSTPLLASSHDGGLNACSPHGLSLVQTLSSCWGVEGTQGGKVVWAELPI
jgi:MEDS: MEthanogen/methylotroph, DcmR Sensory domain